MAEYALKKDALDKEPLDRLEAQLFASPFVADSPLQGTFEGSRGFAVIFTEAGRAELEARFPYLSPFLDAVLDEGLHTRLLSLTDRWKKRRPRRANAFYLNLLLLGPGNFVGRHVDATLRDASGVKGALPERVAVLYLRVPTRRGGELLLFRHRAPVGRIAPRRGSVVVFRGELAHEVRPFESDAEGALRASLVLEQYALEGDALARLPPLKVCSKAGFAAYLKCAQDPDFKQETEATHRTRSI